MPIATLSAAEAAVILGISKDTVIRAYHRGEIAGFRTSGARTSHIRLYPQSVENFHARVQCRVTVPTVETEAAPA